MKSIELLKNAYFSWCQNVDQEKRFSNALLVQNMSSLLYTQGVAEEFSIRVAKSILVIRLDEIGDVTLMSGMLRELRRNAPQSRITLVVKKDVYDLVRYCPYVDEVLVFNSVELLKQGGIIKVLQEIGDFCARHFWGQQIDLCLVPRYDFDRYFASILAYVSGAKRRVGFSEKATPWKARQNAGFDRLLTDVVPVGRLAHEVEHNCALIRFLGGTVENMALELWVTEEAKLWAETQFSGYGEYCKIALSLGPGQARRTWPVERMLEISRVLQAMGKRVLFVLFGTKEEQNSAALFQRQSACEVLNMTGQTTLQQTAAMLQLCRIYLGRNTGIMHMAAAAGLQVLEISCYPKTASPWGIDSPVRFRAWCRKAVLLQPIQAQTPCEQVCQQQVPHCILQITEQQVLEAVVSFLG